MVTDSEDDGVVERREGRERRERREGRERRERREGREGREVGPVRAGLAGWKLVVIPMAIVTGFFAVDLAADLFAGVSPMHLGLDIVALCVAILGLGGALRRR